MMLEVVLVISPIFTLFISFFPKRIPRLNRKKDHGQNTKLVQGRWRRFWHSWVPIPTSVGVTVLAVLQWRRLQRERDLSSPSTANEFKTALYCSLPLRLWSRTWGWFTNCQIPTPLRSWVYGFYSKMTGANLDEVSGNLTDYPSLCQFFTRQLKEGLRPIDPNDCIVSPADGRVLNCGEICSCNLDQVKGVKYRIQTFLGNPTWQPSSSSQSVDDDSSAKFIKEVTKPDKATDENENEVVRDKSNVDIMIPETFWGGIDVVRYLFRAPKEQDKSIQEKWEDYKMELLTNPNNELYQVVVYLAPGDYHRFHSPVEWQVKFRRHFQGELLSVNPLVAGWLPGLFTLNERVVYFGEWKHGFFSMTAVGATSVGSIKVYSDKTLHTNSYKWRDGSRHKDRVMDAKWNKGEEVGEFRLGSTIVLIFEAPKGYKFNLCSEQKVKVGEAISGCKI